MSEFVVSLVRRRACRGAARVLAISAFAAALSANALTAEDRPAVHVRCKLSSAALQGFYGQAGVAEVAAGLCRELVDHHLAVHPRLRFWRYEVDGDLRGVGLDVDIRDGAATETLGRVRLLKKDEDPPPFCGDAETGGADGQEVERRCWQAVIHEPGETGDPLPAEAPEVFGNGIREKILDRFLVEIEDRLKRKMPLARAVWLGPDQDPPTLVAALPWSDFQRLRKSSFQVLCFRADVGVEISAVGHAVPASFPPGGTPRIAEAFVVEVLDPDDIHDLSMLTPGPLYLVRYDPPEIDTVNLDFFGEVNDDP